MTKRWCPTGYKKPAGWLPPIELDPVGQAWAEIHRLERPWIQKKLDDYI